MALLKQSAAYTRVFLLVEASDHLTGLTGATPSVSLSKAGAAFAAAAGTVTELANGWYKIALTTADTNTLGDLAFHITATSGDPTDFVDQVVANILGDNLPVDAASVRTAVGLASADLDTQLAALPTNAELAAALAGADDATLAAIAGLPTAAENATAVWTEGSRTLTAGTNIVLAKDTGITGFNDLDAADIRSATGLAAANLDTQLGAISAVTDKLADTLEDNEGTFRFTAASLAQAPSGGGGLTANGIADAILDRDMSVGTDSGSSSVRTVRQALRALRNKVAISGTTMTVSKEDDATASWTATLTTNGSAEPITAIDPAGP